MVMAERRDLMLLVCEIGDGLERAGQAIAVLSHFSMPEANEEPGKQGHWAGCDELEVEHLGTALSGLIHAQQFLGELKEALAEDSGKVAA
jgi:hypothetical protein